MIEIVMNKNYPKSLEEFKEIVKDTTRDDLVQGLYDISQQALEFQTELQNALDRANSKLKEQIERNLRAIEFININSDVTELLNILEGEVK